MDYQDKLVYLDRKVLKEQQEQMACLELLDYRDKGSRGSRRR